MTNPDTISAPGQPAFPRHPRLRSFTRKFGQPALSLACHAAFPIALTPDLLYSLWGAFPSDARGQPIGAPWVAVADLLLSGLCDEVGHELFELVPEVRDELLAELRSSPRFGPQRIAELSAFVSEYVGQQLRSSDPFVRDFAEAQHWAARAATDPAGAAAELARAYSELEGTERDRLLRLEAIVAAIAQPERASELESLLPYARALADWARGDTARAATVLNSMANATGQIQLGGLVLPLPPAMASPPPGSAAQAISAEVTQQVDYSEVQPEASNLSPANQDLAQPDAQQAQPPVPEGDGHLAQLRHQREVVLRQLRALEQQQAYMGPSLPAHIVVEIEDLKATIARLDAESRAIDPSGTIGTLSTDAEQIAHLQQLRQIKLRRLRILEEQRKVLVTAPLWLTNQITLLQDEIAQIEQQLRAAGIAPADPAPRPANEPPEAAILDKDEREALLGVYWVTQRRLKIREEQEAQYGGIDAPPEIRMEIEDLRAKLASLERQLGGVPPAEQPNPQVEGLSPLGDDERAQLTQQYWQSDRRLKILEIQSARFARRDVPPEIMIQIEDLRRQLANLELQLGGVPPAEQPAPAVETNVDLSADERAQLFALREAHQRRLQVLEERQARLGSLYTPPEIVMEIEGLRAQLAELDHQLAAAPAVEPTQSQQEAQPATEQDTPAQAITLHIARQGQGYSISLVGAGSILRARLALNEAQLAELAGRARQALNEVVYTQVNGQYVYQQEQTIISPVVHAQALQTLARVGFLLYEQLFYGPGSGEDVRTLGDRLRELSQGARLRITIVAEHFFLPWALLYDRATIEPGNIEIEGFWGLRHVIECQVPSAEPNQPAPLGDEAQADPSFPAIAPREQLRLAFVSNNNLDHEIGEPIVQNQRAQLGQLPNVLLLDFSTVAEVYNLLGASTPAELIYYFGSLSNGGSGDQSADSTALTLADGRLSLAELQTRAPRGPLPGRPLVFLNTCRFRKQRVDGLTSYFLLRGARTVIGSEADLPAFFAAEFGQEFVALFAAGEQSAGNLLLSLRRAYAEQRLNLLGLCYTLYGHADTRVEWPNAEPPGASQAQFA